MKEFDHISIEALKLPKRIYHALVRGGVLKIGDLRKFYLNKDKYQIRNVGGKSLDEISKALEELRNNSSILSQSIKGSVVDEHLATVENKAVSWAQIVEDYFQNEKDVYSYILISRFGFSPKTLEEIATELGVTRERVRQIQEAVVVRYLNHIRFSGGVGLLGKIEKIFSVHGDDLSLPNLKTILKNTGVLGRFSEPIKTTHIKNVNLLETLICWLGLISNKKYTLQPIEFSVDIFNLTKAGKTSIKDHAALMNISTKERRKIKRKVLFTGGITIKEASKILSKDERITVMALKNLNLQKIDSEWFSCKSLTQDKDNSKIPLRVAGLKMLAVNPTMNIDTFHDGLRRHASRFYTSIAPVHVIEHILPKLGFEINDSNVSTQLSTKGILSKSEKSLISAISKNEGVASFLEIAEEFFTQNLSLPAVSVTLKRSPIVEKVNEGFHKLRGTEISWQDIEVAQKRQKRFAQDDEIAHGLDGIVRMRFTVNSYAFLTGVVGANSVKEMLGSWDLIYNGSSIGEVKVEDPYLWGLAKLFKELGVKMGDRMEIAFNTWNRSLSVWKVKNENS